MPFVNVPKRPSTYRGVKWISGRWRALITADSHQQSLGSYDTEEAAARAYDDKAKQLRAKPTLNFLPDGTPNPHRKKNWRTLYYGSRQGTIRIAGVKEELGSGRRPRKRGRWEQQEEDEELTVGIKKEEEDMGTVGVKGEEDMGTVGVKEEGEGGEGDVVMLGDLLQF